MSCAARILSAVVAVAVAAPHVWGRDIPPMPQPSVDGPAPWRAPLPVVKGPAPPSKGERICVLIEQEAKRHGLPPEFFARLIWKESRFDAKAVSPKGAQGIAQFMPSTARLRGLQDPFDPAQALAASAAYLADLREMFGNLGLAAAAYNSGENRVARWLASGGRLPYETVDYVQSITFRPVEWFREPGREVEPRPLAEGKTFMEGCSALPVIATRALAQSSSPWGVRVAGGISPRAARRAFRRAQRLYPSVLAGRSPIVRRTRNSRGRFVAMVGAPSRASARRLCARLIRAGGNCVVQRNR